MDAYTKEQLRDFIIIGRKSVVYDTVLQVRPPVVPMDGHCNLSRSCPHLSISFEVPDHRCVLVPNRLEHTDRHAPVHE